MATTLRAVCSRVVRRGDSFGEMALVGEGGRRSATVAALEDSETFSVYEHDFHALRRRHPAIDHLVADFLANEVRMLNERLLEALYVPVERRVLRRLCELARLYPARTGETLIPLTQEVLAELAGTSRATVNRVLDEEQERGTVDVQRGKTLVRDFGALARRAR